MLNWRSLGRYVLPLILLLLWEGIYVLVGEPAMASPWQSISALFANFPIWLSDVVFTLRALIISFLISAGFGVTLGFFIGLSKFWTEVISPILLVLYSIPKITLYPIFLLIFGLTVQGRIAFSVIHGILPIMLICIEATRTVPRTYQKLAKSYQLSFFKQAWYILIPSIRPHLVVGLRMWVSAFVSWG